MDADTATPASWKPDDQPNPSTHILILILNMNVWQKCVLEHRVNLSKITIRKLNTPGSSEEYREIVREQIGAKSALALAILLLKLNCGVELASEWASGFNGVRKGPR